jgi:hypothetical protein
MALRDKIGVENGEKLGPRACDRGVDVPGLGMPVVGPGQIAGPALGAIGREPVTLAVVQNPEIEFPGRPVDRRGPMVRSRTSKGSL